MSHRITQGNDSDNESQDESRNDSEMESYNITGMRDPCQEAEYRGINARQIAFLFHHQFIQIATNTRDQPVKTLVPLGTSPDLLQINYLNNNYLEYYIR